MRASLALRSKVSLFPWHWGPGGRPQGDQRLILPYTKKSKMFFTVFTSIKGNRMCSSKWRHAEGKHTGYWTGHFKLKKDQGIAFKHFTSIPQVLTFTTFFLLQLACCLIFRHEISYWNQLWVYNLCWVPTIEKKPLLRRLFRRLLPPQWSN